MSRARSLISDLPPTETRLEREKAFWRDSEVERPGAFTAELLVHKMAEAAVLLEAIRRHRARFQEANAIVELGAGQGWASCLVKALFGGRVIATDVGDEAVASVPEWERVFGVKLDGAFGCPSFAVPLGDESADLIFAFQAAHHFGAHKRTLAEARRLLRPGGFLLYLHEPTAPRWIYRRAIARANRKRSTYGHDVVEDVLVPTEVERLGEAVGLGVTVTRTPTLMNRHPKEFIYYLGLRTARPLQPLLPCTADFIFTKPKFSNRTPR